MAEQGRVSLWRPVSASTPNQGRPPDALSTELFDTLGRIMQRTRQDIVDLLHQEQHQLWLWLDDDSEQFLGFVLLALGPANISRLDNAFISIADQAQLNALGDRLFHVEQVWARCGHSEAAQVLSRVLGERCAVLKKTPTPALISCAISTNIAHQPVVMAVKNLSFKAQGQVQQDWQLALSGAQNLPPTAPAIGDNLTLRSFADPPAADALIAFMAKTFGPDLHRLSAQKSSADDDSLLQQAAMALLSRSLGDDAFDPQASHWLSDQDRLVGFIWLYRLGHDRAHVSLAAIDKKLRGTGISRALAATLRQRWRQRGYQQLRFSIASDNTPALAAARALGANVQSLRQTWVWSHHDIKTLL